MEVGIIVLLSILVLISTFISTRGSLTDNRINGIKRFTKNGIKLILVNLFIILLLLFQYFINECKLEQKEIKNNQKQEKRDSILKVNYDSSLMVLKSKFDASNLKTVTTVTEILARYGLLFDSASNVLVKIVKDSSKTKVILPNDPVLQISSINAKVLDKNMMKFYIEIISADASSTGFNIIVNNISYDSLGICSYYGKSTPIIYTDKIAMDDGMGYYVSCSYTASTTVFYFQIKGTYFNSDFSKSYTIDNICFYDIKSKSFGSIKGKTREKIIECIKAYQMN